MANAVVVLGLIVAIGGGLISISIHKIEEGELETAVGREVPPLLLIYISIS